jgi:hypothetical protein
MKHNLNKEPTRKKRKLQMNNTSGFTGVRKKGEGYQATIYIDSTGVYLGLFNTAEQAAIAYDHAASKHGRPKSSLNFPKMKHNLNVEPQRKRRKIVSSTGFRGISLQRSGRYGAAIKVNGKMKSLGTYDTREDAARVYDAAVLKHDKPTTWLNFPQQIKQYYCGIEIKDEPSHDQISANAEWL